MHNIRIEGSFIKRQTEPTGVISAAMLSSDIRNVKFIFFIALIISICG
jgi:hypothetical protein